MTLLIAAVVAHGTCDAVRRCAVSETDKGLSALAKLPASASRDLLAAIATELAARAR
jgi:geranylgeranyl pyrophosphate synthase